LPCYEPLFGHQLELFPARQLHVAPVNVQLLPGLLNMADPRCYLTPGERGCEPGALFASAELPELLSFAAREPLAWNQPTWQRAAASATLASLALSALAFAAFGWRALARWRRARSARP
jgi:hypothetical protein